MWIPGGIIFIAVALGILGSWFHEGDREEDRLVYPLVARRGATTERNVAQP